MSTLNFSRKIIAIAALVLFVSVNTFAGAVPPPPPPPLGVPLDAGTIILLVIGAIVGCKIIIDRRQQAKAVKSA